jgi:hypothetical protein
MPCDPGQSGSLLRGSMVACAGPTQGPFPPRLAPSRRGGAIFPAVAPALCAFRSRMDRQFANPGPFSEDPGPRDQSPGEGRRRRMTHRSAMIRDRDEVEIRLTSEAEYLLPFTFIEARNEGTLFDRYAHVFREAARQHRLFHIVNKTTENILGTGSTGTRRRQFARPGRDRRPHGSPGRTRLWNRDSVAQGHDATPSRRAGATRRMNNISRTWRKVTATPFTRCLTPASSPPGMSMSIAETLTRRSTTCSRTDSPRSGCKRSSSTVKRSET